MAQGVKFMDSLMGGVDVSQPTRPTSKRQSTNDGLHNVVTGIGTGASQSSYNIWSMPNFNDMQTYQNLYSSSAIARQIIDVPARDATSQWRTIKCCEAEKIASEERRVRARERVQEALTWSALYGGCSMIMITDQPLDKPLNLNKLKKGSLKRLQVIDRYYMVPEIMNTFDPLAANYMCPEYYMVTGGTQRVHWTHVCRFVGDRLPLRLNQTTWGWGASKLVPAISHINALTHAMAGLSDLIGQCNLDVVSVEGLNDQLTSDQEGNIINRFRSYNLSKSINNMSILDSTEKLERMTLSLGGVSPVIEQLITMVSASARIPVTKLFGTSAKGMNATGEGDMRTYHESLRAIQSEMYEPLCQLDEVLVRSALGEWDDNFDFEWNDLEVVDEESKARAQLLHAQRDAVYLEQNIITKSQVQRALQSDEVYQFDDEEIAALEEAESQMAIDPDALQPTNVNENINLGSEFT